MTVRVEHAAADDGGRGDRDVVGGDAVGDLDPGEHDVADRRSVQAVRRFDSRTVVARRKVRDAVLAVEAGDVFVVAAAIVSGHADADAGDGGLGELVEAVPSTAPCWAAARNGMEELHRLFTMPDVAASP